MYLSCSGRDYEDVSRVSRAITLPEVGHHNPHRLPLQPLPHEVCAGCVYGFDVDHFVQVECVLLRRAEKDVLYANLESPFTSPCPKVSGPGVVGDPHMIGFHGQKIDWKGEDGGWYNIMFDTVADIQMNVRLTAPLAEDFPERQLITGFALKYDDDHSVVIETKKPKTTETEGCPDDSVTCIGENALRLTIDGEEHPAIPAERAPLTEDSFMTASNLPAECQPYGGDIVWARTFAKMKKRRLRADAIGLDEWVLGWSASTAAPSWCDKFVSEAGISGLIEHRSKHTAFNIVTPSLALRLHHGTNHQVRFIEWRPSMRGRLLSLCSCAPRSPPV